MKYYIKCCNDDFAVGKCNKTALSMPTNQECSLECYILHCEKYNYSFVIMFM